MKLFNLIPDDSGFNDWLFWYEDEAGYVRPRQMYADLVCRECGKLDEVVALGRGIDPSVTIRSKRDFVELSDGLIAISNRLKEFFNDEGIKGLRFLDLADGERCVLWPDVRVQTDLNSAGFQFVEPKCVRCGRYREVCVGPLSRSLQVPEDPMVVFASEVWNENRRGRVLWLFVQERVAATLKKRSISGLEVLKAA